MSFIITAYPYGWPIFQHASSSYTAPVGIQFHRNHDGWIPPTSHTTLPPPSFFFFFLSTIATLGARFGPVGPQTFSTACIPRDHTATTHTIHCDIHCALCMSHFYMHFLWQCAQLACICESVASMYVLNKPGFRWMKSFQCILSCPSWGKLLAWTSEWPWGWMPCNYTTIPRGAQGRLINATALMDCWWLPLWRGGGSWGQRHRRCWGGFFSGAQRVVDQLRLTCLFSLIFLFAALYLRGENSASLSHIMYT